MAPNGAINFSLYLEIVTALLKVCLWEYSCIDIPVHESLTRASDAAAKTDSLL